MRALRSGCPPISTAARFFTFIGVRPSLLCNFISIKENEGGGGGGAGGPVVSHCWIISGRSSIFSTVRKVFKISPSALTSGALRSFVTQSFGGLGLKRYLISYVPKTSFI
uniref:Uncharacterized protein n=1 Tax=Romanomermis culicivorax TaxID=13658 RepID=A0A915INN1_ROMCU